MFTNVASNFYELLKRKTKDVSLNHVVVAIRGQ